MVTTRGRWLIGVLGSGVAGIIAGCSADAVSPSSQPKPKPKPQYLWAALGSGTVVELSPAQLAQSGTPSSLPSFTIPNQPIVEKTVLDTAGTLWISDAGGYVHGYTASQLAQVSGAGGAMAPAVSLAINYDGAIPLSEPAALTFDTQGDLWVADVALSTLYMYPPIQLGTSGAPAPMYEVNATYGYATPQIPYLNGPNGMAFDQQGVLWVNVLAGVIGFRPSTLATPSGSPNPDYLLYATPGTGRPEAVAFDANGNLWVADSPDTVAMFSQSALQQLAVNPHPSASQIMIVPGNPGYVETLAFDRAGNLWVAAITMNQLVRFPATQGFVSSQPDVQITLPSDARGLTFDPAN